jgi:hypothetical protein
MSEPEVVLNIIWYREWLVRALDLMRISGKGTSSIGKDLKRVGEVIKLSKEDVTGTGAPYNKPLEDKKWLTLRQAIVFISTLRGYEGGRDQALDSILLVTMDNRLPAHAPSSPSTSRAPPVPVIIKGSASVIDSRSYRQRSAQGWAALKLLFIPTRQNPENLSQVSDATEESDSQDPFSFPSTPPG